MKNLCKIPLDHQSIARPQPFRSWHYSAAELQICFGTRYCFDLQSTQLNYHHFCPPKRCYTSLKATLRCFISARQSLRTAYPLGQSRTHRGPRGGTEQCSCPTSMAPRLQPGLRYSSRKRRARSSPDASSPLTCRIGLWLPTYPTAYGRK